MINERIIRTFVAFLCFGVAILRMLEGDARADTATVAASVKDEGIAQEELLSNADRTWIEMHGPIRFGLPVVGWPPFDVLSSASEYRGITADYIKLLSAKLGFEAEQVPFASFSDALDALRQGNIDAMGSIARTPDREAFALFTLPYVRSQPVIITRKDDTAIHSLPDLAGRTVAIEKGFAARGYIKDLPNIILIEFVSTKDALEAVSLGRANAYVGSLISSTYIMDREAMSNLEVRSASDLPISDIRFAVKKSEPELARLFDHGLASISAQEHAAIRKKWIGIAGLGVDWGQVLRIAIPVGGALVSIILVILIWNGRLRRQVARRRAVEQRLREIGDSVPGVVYQLHIRADGTCAYTFMTNGVQALCGFSREAALRDSRVLWNQVLDEDKSEFDLAIRNAVAVHAPIKHEFRIRMPDGTLKWLQSAAEPSRTKDDGVVYNGYWVDVTQHRDMEMALEEARISADAANRAKSSFLAAMSHEIRTPMNGVLGMLELLSLPHLSGTQRSNVEIIRESGRSLLRVVDDILDFSKIEAGKLDLRPEPTSVADIVHGVREIYSGSASAKNLLLTAEIDTGLSPALVVDPLRLRQILNNFVSNSIKFTNKGSVAISAETVERRKDGAEIVCFAVTDTGIGISPENQKKLFQPFVQAEGDTTRRFGGTGLGLVICRRIADLMGGTIDMDSKPGRGTKMRLVLPLMPAVPGEIKASEEGADVSTAFLSARRRAPDPRAAEAEGTLVLVADDHPTNRVVIKRQLNLLGYAAEIAEDGREALEQWRSGRFGLVITDCHMPEMDGYELSRMIRNIEKANGGRHTPIIACTANVLEGEAESCLAAGMDGYLAKPVELRPLLRLLDRWLPIPFSAASPTIRETEEPTRAAEAGYDDPPPPIDRAKLAEISLGDEAFEREMLSGFRDAAEEDSRQLADALESGNCDAITRIAHRIKAASRAVGATWLAELSERMERAGRSDDQDGIAGNRQPLLQEMQRVRKFLGQMEP